VINYVSWLGYKDEDEEGQSRTTITYIYAYVFYGFYGSSMI